MEPSNVQKPRPDLMSRAMTHKSLPTIGAVIVVGMIGVSLFSTKEPKIEGPMFAGEATVCVSGKCETKKVPYQQETKELELGMVAYFGDIKLPVKLFEMKDDVVRILLYPGENMQSFLDVKFGSPPTAVKGAERLPLISVEKMGNGEIMRVTVFTPEIIDLPSSPGSIGARMR